MATATARKGDAKTIIVHRESELMLCRCPCGCGLLKWLGREVEALPYFFETLFVAIRSARQCGYDTDDLQFMTYLK